MEDHPPPVCTVVFHGTKSLSLLNLQRLNSSLRIRTPQETLQHAMALAPGLGITRVTDTTWLDRIGIPVFASIRPAASPFGSLCVNAGKGLRDVEAQVGAYMEAIEFAYAEYGFSAVSMFESSPAEIVATYNGKVNFVDFCPIAGKVVAPDDKMLAVRATDILDGSGISLPAELVYLPLPGNFGQTIFGQTSNGLCSGNSVDEATLHGLNELMERDVRSFNSIFDNSRLVEMDEVPVSVDELLAKIRNAQLNLSIRYTENCFGFAYFEAFVMEHLPEAPISIASGSGLHPIKEVALIRAVSEAAQSRLSHIHGGRDDIIDRVKYFEATGRDAEVEAIKRLRSHVESFVGAVRYSKIESYDSNILSIDDAMWLVKERLRACGVRSIARVTLTPEHLPLHVVRVVVPSLEHFKLSLPRMGPRLLSHVSKYR